MQPFSNLSEKTVKFSIRYFITTALLIFSVVAILKFHVNLYFIPSSFVEGLTFIISLTSIALAFLLRYLKSEKDISEENYMLCMTLSIIGAVAPWISILIMMTMLH